MKTAKIAAILDWGESYHGTDWVSHNEAYLYS